MPPHFPEPYIAVHDNVIPASFCQKLIDKFEANEDQVQMETGPTAQNQRHFMEVNLSERWPDEHATMVNIVQHCWKSYFTQNFIQYDVQWPRQFGYEAFRMKRYLPFGKDHFPIHTDVGSHASARRFLAFLWYLNTVREGGETQFGLKQDDPQVTVKAVQGRVLMFPPFWTHPHWGCKPISETKYIVSGYLHLI